MRHRPMPFTCVAAALAFTLVLSGADVHAGGDEGPFDVAIQPGQSLERCLVLAYAEPVSYRFNATVPVRFEIRPQQRKRGNDGPGADDVPSALRRDGVVMLALTFRPPLEGTWCWSWRNGSDVPVRLVGTVERFGAPR